MNRFIDVLKKPKYYFIILQGKIMKDSIENDIKYLKKMYKYSFGKNLDLDNPRTYNEKLQWLKVYDRNPLYTKLVDKYEVKNYVKEKIGEDYIIPTLGVWNKFDEIDFNKLPNKFVLKCTHDSGGLVICTNKENLNIKSIRKKINHFLKRNYYKNTREWPYKNVRPRMIAEEYIKPENVDDLNDYKFFVFNGKVHFFKIDFDRFIKHGANYYDREKNILPFGEVICPPNYEKKINIPKNIDEMIKLAEKLASNIPFVRVDFYNVDGKIYFGEITFFPASGFGKFMPEEWDKKIGNLLEIKNMKGNRKNE